MYSLNILASKLVFLKPTKIQQVDMSSYCMSVLHSGELLRNKKRRVCNVKINRYRKIR